MGRTGAGYESIGSYEENFEPERTKLLLPVQKSDIEESAIKIGDKKSAISQQRRQMIVQYLTEHTNAKTAEIAVYLDLKPSRVRDYLSELIAENIVVAEGNNKGRVYALKDRELSK